MLREIHGITFTVHGTTQNPPETVTELLEGRYEERDAGNDKNIITQLKPDFVRFMPVIKVDKRMTVHLYNS